MVDTLSVTEQGKNKDSQSRIADKLSPINTVEFIKKNI
jgi:hypothetical protein